MSLVGPRPLLLEYLPLYSTKQARRHEVKPGVTGWAQVNGRNTITWSEKFDLDVWYVDNQSFWLDIKILFLESFIKTASLPYCLIKSFFLSFSSKLLTNADCGQLRNAESI